MNFQMLYRPTSVVFVDDDVDYLEMVRMAFPRDWRIEVFSRPGDCIERLQQDAQSWERDLQMHQNLVEIWRTQEQSLLVQVLGHWENLMSACKLSGLCFVDYAMPGINGLQLLEQVATWPGGRVLLTGQADEHLAIAAFNQGLINQYVPKQDSQVRGRLLALAQTPRKARHARHEQIWLGTLTPSQFRDLNGASAQALVLWAQERWSYYLCMGEPFGILGQTAEGQMQWLQLETQDRLTELAQLLEGEQVTAEQRESVGRGLLLPDLDVRLHLSGTDPVRLAPAQCWGEGENAIYSACFDLSAHP